MKTRTKNNCNRTIVAFASRKLRSNRGETIVEALVSLIIAVISIALLVTSVTVASKINAKSKASTTEQLSFAYVDSAATILTGGTSASESPGTATIDFGDSATATTNRLTVTPNITVYTTDNGYTYYMKN